MTIKKTLIGAASVAALALAATAAPAAAEDREFGWSITVGGTSDYIFRGVSFTQEDPAAQGSIDFSYGILYAGAWASNIDSGAFEPWELDLYVGVKPTLGPVTFDFAVLAYTYPAAVASDDLNYIEVKAGASMEIVKSLTGSVAYYHQFDNSGNVVDADYVEGTLAYGLPQWGMFSPAISGTLGYAVADDTGGLADDYTYWNAGLSLTVEKFTMDFRYWDTDISDSDAGGAGNFFSSEDNADERFVFTAKVTLP